MAKVEVDYICDYCGDEQTFECVIERGKRYEFHKCKNCPHWNTFRTNDILDSNMPDEQILSVSTEQDTDDEPGFDTVHKPQGYNSYDLETINAIRGQSTDEEFQGYLKGNVMKYVARYEIRCTL